MNRVRKQRLILYTLSITLAGFILLFGFRQLPIGIGGGDFRAYWSTSHLLVQGQDCSDDSLLLAIQNNETRWPRDYPMRIWNPPWVSAWFLPLASLNFQPATQIWLLINIVLLLTSIFLAGRLFTNETRQLRLLLLLALGAILFPSSIVTIFMGQVNLLVLAGLILFLWLLRNRHDLGAGVALSLTLVKPHLIYLALLIILLVVLRERRWKVVIGFGLALLLAIGVVLLRRPSFIFECLASTGSGNLLAWHTPTLTTYLQVTTGWSWLRIAGLFLMPLAIWFWFRFRDRLPFLVMIDLAVIASVITTPFAWSYDFVVLLLPLMHCWSWLVAGEINRLQTALIVTSTSAMYLVYYYQRIRTPNELYFFWIPLVIAAIYFWTWRSVKNRKLTGSYGPGDGQL